MGRLAAAVHVQHPTSREWTVLEPGDEPGEEVAAEITNPHAWEDDEPSSDPEESEADEPVKDEPPLLGVTPLPEPEPAQSASRRRRKNTDTET